MASTILTPTHLLLVLAVALLVFGPKRLPQMGRSLGQSIRELKEGLSTVADETKSALEPSDPAQ